MLTQTVQGLRDGNGPTEQRAHLTRERGNILKADALPEMLFLAAGAVTCGRESGSAAIRRRDFKGGGKESAPAQKLEGGFAVLGLDQPLHRSAARRSEERRVGKER